MANDNKMPRPIALSIFMTITAFYFIEMFLLFPIHDYFALHIGCQHLIPKLGNFVGVVSTDQLCKSNDVLWTALAQFVGLDFLAITIVRAWNRKYTLPTELIATDKRILRTAVFLFALLIALLLIFVFSDLRISIRGSASSPLPDIGSYARAQLFHLFYLIGLVNWGFLAIFLPIKYYNIKLEN